MKTKILILLLAGMSFLVRPAGAQLSPGIKGGVNFANLNGYNGENRVSIHAGLFLHHTINNRWCLQPEVLYSGEGQRYFTENGDRILALDYVQIPLMVQYYPTSQLYFEFGPQLGILASAKDYPDDDGVKLNVKDEFTPTQVGLNVGIGVKANQTLGFYGRYNFGLTDVGRFDNIVDQSRVGQLGVTIRLK